MNTSSAALRDCWFLTGPTASGKTEIGLELAELLGAEIVSLDSMAVYRGMDIGTAKPTPVDRAEVAHHGLDLADPSQDVTLVRFKAAADAALADIDARRHRALLVAGTGLYLRAVIDGLDPPGQWPLLRVQFEDDPDLPGLYRRLVELDPATAAKTDPANRRRIARALEVTVGGGRPFSDFGPGLATYPTVDTVQIGLRELYQSSFSNVGETFAGVIIAVIPLVILLLLFQKQLVRGLTTGAVKG